MVKQQALDQCFQALADSTRRDILEQLRTDNQTLGQLAAPLPMTLAAVQKHVRILEDAGLVSSQKIGRNRVVTLEAAPMHNAIEWMQRYHQFWADRLDALGTYLEEQHDN